MPASIPASHLDLVERPLYAIFTTISPQGAPENTVMWFSWDGAHVLVNTVVGRRKVSNVRRNPKVALTILDPDNPFRWIDVRGEVVAIEEDSGHEHIDALAQRYTGKSHYYGDLEPAAKASQEQRLILKIRPRRVLAYPRPTA